MPKHVYFVDDEPDVRDVVRKTLERRGMEVSTFASSGSCLRDPNLPKCDLLITDVMMPGTDGLGLLGQVTQKCPWLPVVVLTGVGDIPMAVRALKAGASDFIEKPLDRESFLNLVERVLEQSGAEDALLGEELTVAERKILSLVLEGANSREIADRLSRSRRTIEVHRSHIMRKLGVENLVDLVKRAAAMGLLETRGPDRPDERAGDSPRDDACAS